MCHRPLGGECHRLHRRTCCLKKRYCRSCDPADHHDSSLLRYQWLDHNLLTTAVPRPQKTLELTPSTCSSAAPIVVQCGRRLCCSTGAMRSRRLTPKSTRSLKLIATGALFEQEQRQFAIERQKHQIGQWNEEDEKSRQRVVYISDQLRYLGAIPLVTNSKKTLNLIRDATESQ